jgi:hypothetical protein
MTGYANFLDVAHWDCVSDALNMTDADFPVLDLFPEQNDFFCVKNHQVMEGIRCEGSIYIRTARYTALCHTTSVLSVKFIRDNWHLMTPVMQRVVRSTLLMYVMPERLSGSVGIIVSPRMTNTIQEINRCLLYVDNCPGSADVYTLSVLADPYVIIEAGLVSSCTDVPLIDLTYDGEILMDVALSKAKPAHIPWRSVTFDNQAVVDAYAETEFGLHVQEVLQVLGSIEVDSVGAPCDGLGVVAEAGGALGLAVVSGDSSKNMCSTAKKMGRDVVYEGYQSTVQRCKESSVDVIVLCYCVANCPSIVEHCLRTDIPLIIITPESAFLGRSEVCRYTATSHVYYTHGLLSTKVRTVRTKNPTCNYLDYYDEMFRYCVDNPMAYEAMQSFLRQGFDVKVSVFDRKFAEGFGDVKYDDYDSIYMYYGRVKTGFAGYIDMTNGIMLSNPFVLLDRNIVVEPGTLLISPGEVEGVHSLAIYGTSVVFRAQSQRYTVHFQGQRSFEVKLGYGVVASNVCHDEGGFHEYVISYAVPSRLAAYRRREEMRLKGIDVDAVNDKMELKNVNGNKKKKKKRWKKRRKVRK